MRASRLAHRDRQTQNFTDERASQVAGSGSRRAAGAALQLADREGVCGLGLALERRRPERLAPLAPGGVGFGPGSITNQQRNGRLDGCLGWWVSRCVVAARLGQSSWPEGEDSV
jgi:hypothetical protein